MDLRILALESPDLEPSDKGLPDDESVFDVKVEVLLCEVGNETESMYFEFTVASSGAVAKRSANAFMPPTLLLENYSWLQIRQHVEKLLMHAKSCRSWECVAFRFGGLMHPSSVSSYKWQF